MSLIARRQAIMSLLYDLDVVNKVTKAKASHNAEGHREGWERWIEQREGRM